MNGRTLGDYDILKLLGKGHVGEIYLAQHRFVRTPFVLKVLSEESSSDRALIKRLEELVAQTALLEHPNIAKTHSLGFDDGRAFIVMDCIADDDGESTNLKQYVQAHPRITEEEICAILDQIARALDYAHSQKNIAHRGLKPSNILMGKKNPLPTVFLIDFGLEQLDPDSLLHEIKRADLLEKIAYLAPEQRWTEKSGFIGMKADTYAFGVLAYWLLMKSYPEGAFPMPAAPWDQLILQTLHPNPTLRSQTLAPLLVPAPALAAALHCVKEPRQPKIEPQAVERPSYEADPAAIFEIEKTVGRYIPKKREAADVQPILTEMSIIPEGEYVRGDNNGARDERPSHKVFLDSFALDIHPVTNEQFIRFLDVMGGEKDVNNHDIIRLKESRIKRLAGKLVIESGYAKHPVVGVTWYGASAYAKWVGKRLPTEAEWEVAARCGDEDRIYLTGSNIERTQANFFSADTVNVMSYAPNGFGLYDMSGNVYEWCFDWYDHNYYAQSQQEPKNPQGPLQGVYRVLRGGCWKSLKEDLRTSHRHRNNPGTANSTYGFRCAADVQQEGKA